MASASFFGAQLRLVVTSFLDLSQSITVLFAGLCQYRPPVAWGSNTSHGQLGLVSHLLFLRLLPSLPGPVVPGYPQWRSSASSAWALSMRLWSQTTHASALHPEHDSPKPGCKQRVPITLGGKPVGVAGKKAPLVTLGVSVPGCCGP